MNHRMRTERLSGDGLLARAEEFHTCLSALVASGDDVTLDLSDVGSADVSFVQLIVSATLTAEGAGRTLTLTGLSPKLRTLFDQAGVGIDPVLGRITRH